MTVLLMLSRTKLALEECQDHLKATGTTETSIESYLTQHILVLLSAEMQQAIYVCLDKKAEQANDKALQEYVSSTRKNIVRGVTKSSISGFVSHFGVEAKRKFDACLKDKEQDISRYGNAIKNRDSVAHELGVQVTFHELSQAVQAAEIILSAVTRALDIVEDGQTSDTPLNADEAKKGSNGPIGNPL